MFFSTRSIITAGLWTLILSGTSATPTSGRTTSIQERDVDIDYDENTFPDSIGTDLTLCYHPGFKKCTLKTNMSMKECFNGHKMDRPGHDNKWLGFTNDAITSCAITGQTPGQCTLYADALCQVPVVEENNFNGDLLVHDILKKYGPHANDKISSVQCFPK